MAQVERPTLAQMAALRLIDLVKKWAQPPASHAEFPQRVRDLVEIGRAEPFIFEDATVIYSGQGLVHYSNKLRKLDLEVTNIITTSGLQRWSVQVNYIETPRKPNRGACWSHPFFSDLSIRENVSTLASYLRFDHSFPSVLSSGNKFY